MSILHKGLVNIKKIKQQEGKVFSTVSAQIAKDGNSMLNYDQKGWFLVKEKFYYWTGVYHILNYAVLWFFSVHFITSM